MNESKLLQEISQKGSDKETIAEKVIKKPELLSELIAGLDAEEASIKYGSEKVLRMMSEKNPEVLYPKIDALINLLDSETTFLKWGAIQTVANLASVDSKGKIDKALKKYLSPIPGPVMITAANVIGGAAKIAAAKPMLAEKIAREVLKVEQASYQTAECRNVAIGHAISTLHQIYPQVKNKGSLVKFIRRQLKNSRPSTRKKAEKFLKKYGI